MHFLLKMQNSGDRSQKDRSASVGELRLFSYLAGIVISYSQRCFGYSENRALTVRLDLLTGGNLRF